jgi:hypothetical protein
VSTDSLDTLIDEHTLLPIWAAFVAQNRYRVARRAMAAVTLDGQRPAAISASGRARRTQPHANELEVDGTSVAT